MPKFFLNNDVILRDDTVFASGDIVHHLLHTLRYKQGQPAIFCDGMGKDIHCIFEGLRKKKDALAFRVLNIEERFNELPYKVTLYQSVIAAGKIDLAIQKSVELGVYEIVPVFTKFTAVKQSVLSEKNARFQKIAENAAEQSMRGYIPQIMSPVKFEDAVSYAKKDDLLLAANESECKLTIAEAANGKCGAISIGIWVGPEGGFSADEIARLKEIGAKSITLGRRILRAETAGLAAMVQLQCALGAEIL